MDVKYREDVDAQLDSHDEHEEERGEKAVVQQYGHRKTQLLQRQKTYNTCIAPQVTYRDFRGAGTTQARADVQPVQAVGQTRRHELASQPNNHKHSPSLSFNGLHPRNPCNYMDYYSFTDPKGMEGWVGLVGWPIADALPTKRSHVNHGWGVDQGKSASYKPTSWPLSYAANLH